MEIQDELHNSNSRAAFTLPGFSWFRAFGREGRERERERERERVEREREREEGREEWREEGREEGRKGARRERKEDRIGRWRWGRRGSEREDKNIVCR